MMVMLLLVSHGGPAVFVSHYLTAFCSMHYWLQKKKTKKKGSKYYLVRPALLK